jgi:SIR2-like domain
LQYYKNSEVGTYRSMRDWLEKNIGRSATKTSVPGGGHYLLLSLPTREYVTTNYEVLLETAAAQVLQAGQWNTTTSAKQYGYHVDSDPITKKVYGKVHGSFDGAGTAAIIATTDDYIQEYMKPRWRTKIRDLVRKRRIVFIGYSLRDFTTWSSYVSAILQNPRGILAAHNGQSSGLRSRSGVLVRI